MDYTEINLSNISTASEENILEVNDYVLTSILGKGTFGVVYSG